MTRFAELPTMALLLDGCDSPAGALSVLELGSGGIENGRPLPPSIAAEELLRQQRAFLGCPQGYNQPFRTTLRNVFTENNLHTKHTPVAIADRTGWAFQRDRSSEDILGQIESAAADPIRQVITRARKRRLPQLEPDPQDALKRFFFAIARRTPESQRRVRAPDAEARHELYIQLSRKAESEGVTLPSEDDFYATPVFRELIDRLFRNADASMAAGTIPSIRRFEDRFFKTRALAVIVITQPKRSFIVGSHGIAIIQGMPLGSLASNSF